MPIQTTEQNYQISVQELTSSVTVSETSTPILITEEVVGVISVTAQGPQGPPGSGEDSHYTHNQTVPADTWTVTHNLGKMPSVAVVDSGNTVVVGEIQYIDDNNLTVSFGAEFTGKAYLN